VYIFDRDMVMEHRGESAYEGVVTRNWSIKGNPNGGYLMAFLASAMQKQSDKKWPVIVTANFLTKCAAGKKATVTVEAISAGKQLNRYQASLTQNGTEITRCWATFMDEGNCDKSANRYERDAPEIPARDLCVALPVIPEFTLIEHMDVLLAPSCAGWLRGDLSPRSEQKGWIKFKDDRPYDALSLLLIADSFPPPILASQGAVAWVPTIEYSVSVRDLADTPWIKAIFRSHYLTCDIIEEDGELWDENGKLLAISRQTAQFRK